MAQPKDYRDLIVWQKAMSLARYAYAQTAPFPKSGVYGLIAQIRRAAVSIPSNIAEGHGRLTDSQFRHFLGNARGSLCELRTQVELAADFGFMEKNPMQDMMSLSAEVNRMLNGLTSSMSELKGGSRAPSPANTASSANYADGSWHNLEEP